MPWAAAISFFGSHVKAPISASLNFITATGRILDAINALLEYDRHIRILGEMKPNEPMDQAIRLCWGIS